MELIKVVPSTHTLFDDWNNMWLAGYRKPHADLTMSGELAIVRAQLPGIHAEHLRVTVDGASVEVRADCLHYPHRMKGVHTPHECVGFYLYLELPHEVKIERARGAYSNGVLELRLPLTHQILA